MCAKWRQMKAATWRAALLSLCAVTALFTVACVLDQIGFGGKAPWYGLWGSTYGPSGQPYRLLVLNVDTGGPSDRAGVRSGDLVDMRSNTLVDRLAQFGQPLNGRPVALSIQRGSRQLRVTVVPGPLTLSRFLSVYLAGDFGSLWLLLFAALIAWRRAYVPGNLLLSTVLICLAIGIVTNPIFFAAPWAWAYELLFICNLAWPISVALWATYASSFAQPMSRPRRLVQWICYASVAIAIAIGTTDATVGIAPFLGIVTLWFDPVAFLDVVWSVPIELAILAASACSVLAIWTSRGLDRQRASWSLVPFAGFYVVSATVNLLSQTSAPYATLLVLFYALNIMVLITPIALTYVALNRRLIDIGFVLNRAVVFAIVSTIVVSAFVLVEWAASERIAGTNQRTSAIASMAAALALGLSLRYIHGFVDRFVDRAFFRKRHEDVAALHRFALEAAYVTERSILLERTVQVVREHTDAQDVTIFVYDGSRDYVAANVRNGDRAPIGENDPGIVSLRVWGKVVDLSSLTSSSLYGEFAFPMVSRGMLLAALVLGTKRDGEAYAPDEFEALLALAHGVATALDTLASRSNGAIESIEATQALIVEKLDSLASRVVAAIAPISETPR